MLEIFFSPQVLKSSYHALCKEQQFPMLRPAVWLTMWSLVQKFTKVT